MRRATAVLLSGLVFVVGGCGGNGDPSPPATSSTSTSTSTTSTSSAAPVVLTAGQPTVKLPQPRLFGINAVRLSLVSVANPTRQGLVVSVDVESRQGSPRTAHVGDVSNVPADGLGDFTLPLTALALELLGQSPTNLVITLRSALARIALRPDVRVTVLAVVL